MKVVELAMGWVDILFSILVLLHLTKVNKFLVGYKPPCLLSVGDGRVSIFSCLVPTSLVTLVATKSQNFFWHMNTLVSSLFG